MQRHLGHMHALRLQVFKHLLAKVQTRRRGGHGARILRENRLVSLLVVFVVGAVDVRRERHMAFAVHHRFEFHRSRRKAQHAGTVFADFLDHRLDAGNLEFTANLERLARAHLRLVARIARLRRNQRLHQKRLHLTTVHRMAIEACRNHLGVVHHQAIAGAEKFHNLGSLHNAARPAVLGAMQYARLALSRRAGRNQFLREFECIIRKRMLHNTFTSLPESFSEGPSFRS